MSRRFHVPSLSVGRVSLDLAQSRHARDVLRMHVGEAVELFDNAGNTAAAVIAALDSTVEFDVPQVTARPKRGMRLVIAAAPPKGPRADWMIEKLSEIGVDEYIPLQSARTVVHPESGKLQRWERIATEAAKQSARGDVMSIDAPMTIAEALAGAAEMQRLCLSTQGESRPLASIVNARPSASLALVGPEGGWTAEEFDLMQREACHFARLTRTILRIETAAIVVAGIMLSQSQENA